MKSRYIEWLQKHGTPLYEKGGMTWRLYQDALVPAPACPVFLDLSAGEAGGLLRESGAWFLRFASGPQKEATEWWYTVCDSYDPQRLSSNTRSKINRSDHSCEVVPVEARWLSMHGYECYSSAFGRYRNAKPVSSVDYHDMIIRTIDGPFEYWAVFVDGNLAGYCQCIVDADHVVTNVFKFHPAFLKKYSSYALITSLIRHYLLDKGLPLSNGSRSVAHDTSFQEFLMKLGFEKLFCSLNIAYQPWLGAAVNALYPARKLIGRIPSKGPFHKLQSLLYQEELRRACRAG